MAINFEVIHKNFDGMMLDLCVQCGGSCEKNEITMFLPGEAEFASKKLNLSLHDFIEKFCNVIKFKDNDIHILKAGVCPFLDKKYRCELEEPNCKPLRCLLYPILLGNSENETKIFVDYKNCPMAYRITEDFKTKAITAYESIKDDIPAWWLEFVSKYDEVVYDYNKLEKLRQKRYIKLSELEDCMVKK